MTDSERLAETDRWLRQATEDLRIAELVDHGENTAPGGACYHAQQAAEKALEAVLVFLQLEFERTHDLDELRNLIPAGWKVKEEHPDLSWLAYWAVKGRYPGPWPDPTEADAQGATRQARAVLEAIDRDLRQHGFEPGPRFGFSRTVRTGQGYGGRAGVPGNSKPFWRDVWVELSRPGTSPPPSAVMARGLGMVQQCGDSLRPVGGRRGPGTNGTGRIISGSTVQDCNHIPVPGLNHARGLGQKMYFGPTSGPKWMSVIFPIWKTRAAAADRWIWTSSGRSAALGALTLSRELMDQL